MRLVLVLAVAAIVVSCSNVRTPGQDCCAPSPIQVVAPAASVPLSRVVSMSLACESQHGIMEVVCGFQLYCTFGNLCTSHAHHATWEWGDTTRSVTQGTELGVHTYPYPKLLPPNFPVSMPFPLGVVVTDDTGATASAFTIVTVDNN